MARKTSVHHFSKPGEALDYSSQVADWCVKMFAGNSGVALTARACQLSESQVLAIAARKEEEFLPARSPAVQ